MFISSQRTLFQHNTTVLDLWRELSMARVLLRNITKRFDEVVAVDNINLEIADQEFLVLVGPSGCGKTTTLRMIAGLEEITEGEIFIGDQLVNNLAPKDRNIAMVFQSYALYPHMKVFDNMAFGTENAQSAQRRKRGPSQKGSRYFRD